MNLNGKQDAGLKAGVKDALAAGSLALLCEVRVWSAMTETVDQFYAEVPHCRTDYAALLLNTAVLTAAFWVGARCMRRYPRGWVRNAGYMGLLLCLLPLVDFIRRMLVVSADAVLRAGLFAVAAGVGVWFFRRPIARLCYSALLALSPVSILAIGYAGYWSFLGEPPPAYAAPRFATNDSSRAESMRVVWIVFDELDQRVAFDARPAGLHLPHLDKFASESVRATAAFPPAGVTLLSVPALLSGREVVDIRVAANDVLNVKFAGAAENIRFPPQDSLVPRLVATGRNVAAIGWYLPYRRLFPPGPHCFSRGFGLPDYQGFRGATVLQAMLRQIQFVMMPSVAPQGRAIFDELHATVIDAATSPAIDFVFAHYSVPHLPGISDPYLGFWESVTGTQAAQYFGNLCLVDQAIGDIQQALLKSRLDRRTAVLITSDHWWRRSLLYDGRTDHRVPFLVRMPDGKSGTMSGGFDAVSTACFAESILAGKIHSSDDALAWLQAMATEQVFTYDARGVRHH